MKAHTILLMALFSSSLFASEINSSNEENEVIIACLSETPVVYINPKKSLLKKINTFLESEVSSGKLSCNIENNESWYCEEKTFRLYQGMNSMGKKMEQGLVCKGEFESPLEKFYKEELILEPTCFRVFWENNNFSAYYGNF